DIAIRRLPTQKIELKTKPGILLPVRGGPYAELALKIATKIASSLNGKITILHKIPGDDISYDLEKDRPYTAVLHSALKNPFVTSIYTIRGDLVKKVRQFLRSHHLIVMGAHGSEPVPRRGFRAREIAFLATVPTIIVQSAQPVTFSSLALAIPPPLSVKENAPEKWFAENTFHCGEFKNLPALIQRKKALDVKISLALPTLNEESTIGTILDVLKSRLMDEYPLLDEIVVIDSGSEDRTDSIARSKNIPVYLHAKILPGYGSFRGKGEALWKSLFVLKGDIIVWMDTDIRNPHPKFIYGVVGPLLYYPKIGYVKGYFKRPLTLGGTVHKTGGGRVTELSVRPMLNLFFPELAGIIQPLSGIYAGRRNILERIPFYTHYGVEIGHLLDILDQFGLPCIAQVDIHKVIHRHQSLSSLSQMSFAIQKIILKRVEEQKKIPLLHHSPPSFRFIVYEAKKLHMESMAPEEHRRPPMITIPEYLRKWKKETTII
ncbi:MAG: glucosyl-3-phosphoglycerate synthase, partial [bacterium]